MKTVLIYLIRLYQKIPGFWHNFCRFTPTCSEYALVAIERFGAFRGSILTIKRICRCNPWGGYGYDPVPDKIKR